MKNHQHRQTHTKLFISIILLFAIFSTTMTIYLLKREENHHIDLLQTRLQAYNHEVYELHRHSNQSLKVWQNPRNDIRLTVINLQGIVLFESTDTLGSHHYTNHLSRKEIQQALAEGEGYTVMRKSESLGQDFFYSATLFDSCIIRSALPYDTQLKKSINGDYGYLTAAIIVTLLLLALFVYMNYRIGKSESDNRVLKERLKLEQEYSGYKNQLSHNIAHELKTPIASIQGYLETIMEARRKGSITPQQENHFLERSLSQVLRLNSLVQDISTLNNMSEQTAIKKEEIDIRHLINDLSDELSVLIEEQQMKIVNEIPENIFVIGDISLVYSIFKNLIDNAIAYAGKNSTIMVGVRNDNTIGKRDGFIQFYISDNGPGVAEEHLGRIFERFYRVDKGRSRKLGGTGLGLAIVKNAIQLHGGSIIAHNAQGGGLMLDFTLPVTTSQI